MGVSAFASRRLPRRSPGRPPASPPFGYRGQPWSDQDSLESVRGALLCEYAELERIPDNTTVCATASLSNEGCRTTRKLALRGGLPHKSERFVRDRGTC